MLTHIGKPLVTGTKNGGYYKNYRYCSKCGRWEPRETGLRCPFTGYPMRDRPRNKNNNKNRERRNDS